MADQITKILIRKGTQSAKDQIILDEAELGYTTDHKRVYIGDGTTTGGNIVGNKYFGEKNLPTQLGQLVEAEYGDTVFDTNQSVYCVLSGTDPEVNDSWLRISNTLGTVTEITAGNGVIFNNADTAITSTGTINLVIDSTKRNPLVSSSNGLLVDYDTIYPVHSVVFTDDNTNPTASGGILEGCGQTWVSYGTVTTNIGGTIYSWLRAG